jgi:hypothetical protein
VWVAGELQIRSATDPWSKGATADVDVVAGTAAGLARVVLAAGERAFLVPVRLDGPASGPIDVHVRAIAADASAGRVTEDLRLEPDAREALLFRRGPSTGNRVTPTASQVFRRSEHVRVEIPPAGPGAHAARVLDRTGSAVPVPVTVGERADEQTGQRWVTAELALAPLAPGDYVLEIAPAGARPILTALRVIR